MKSIKPGRGPSLMGGITGLFVALFGIIWTVLAVSMGGGLFALFGVVFVAIAVVQSVYNLKNATGKNRYSSFDITDGSEESDPLNEHFGREQDDPKKSARSESKFCPYCGTPVSDDYEYCPNCGRRLP